MSERIVPSGPFRLRASAEFGFGQRHAARFDGVMRMAFALDGTFEPVAVAVRQAEDDGPVEVEVLGSADVDRVVAQTARVLSLDHDAASYPEVGQRDPVVGKLMELRPGLRPPLFHSPYEAAAWAVLSARQPALQMATVRDRLAAEHGRVFRIAGQELPAFPSPEALLAVDRVPGLPELKVQRLHAVARAASDGLLDVDRLRALRPEEAHAQVLTLPGIGPFYAALVVLRAVGFADVPVTEEPRALELMGRLYGLGRPATADDVGRLSEPWRPWRTWTAVLVRAAGPLLGTPEER
ncbi:DNA-3-methyladenine glycosylase family protein [Petropleomorpha daqingensis]|uniref:DNA-3-methyladenine glycosylase II n=1 Tax=Petropleomorpha daqingensis TaxID=2026353 RepID=A0A853CSG2_9ACTN|nr:DNA-3-methyladenine glycosylase 2 family protein [Petropleomorpha daqingensis]NYJ08823.1 DNA-3-methyladenine glycosylase II [Petropleomorpha daqingensis]